MSSAQSRDPLEELRALYGLGSRALREFSVVAPKCSLAFGASGIAYALARTAQLRGDCDLLLAADSWVAAAQRHASDERAFVLRAPRFTRRDLGFASLVFAEPGLPHVKAIVRSQMGDRAGADAAALQFLEMANTRLSRIADLHLGGLGLALGAKNLTSSVSSAKLRRELANFGHSVVRRAWAKTGTKIRRNRPFGFAHGIAGQVYATYACGEPSLAAPIIEQLREAAIPHQKILVWTERAGGSRFSAGWCNGLAGHLLLWTTIWRHSRAGADREIVDRLASGVWKWRASMGSVCCGGAGQAITLAGTAAATGNLSGRRKISEWLGSLQPRWPTDHNHRQSLIHGRLGFLLARMECEYAARPQFPVYEHQSHERERRKIKAN
ncbi:MAG: lanthionine synthetase LanC family protein [Candidatus Acidiferrales bacterium]